MKHPKLTRPERLLFALPLLSLLAWLVIGNDEPFSIRYPFLSNTGMRRVGCAKNLVQLGQSLALYSHDYDGRFPPAIIGGVNGTVAIGGVVGSNSADHWTPVGWVDALYPYNRDTNVYSCPAAAVLLFGNAVNGPITHYWYNGNLLSLAPKDLMRPAATLMVGDGNDAGMSANGAYSHTSLPSKWLSSPKSPSYRHVGGANYLFVDGHVEWLRPGAISTAPGAQYTFSPR